MARALGIDIGGTKLAPPDVVERTGTLVGRAVASVANVLDLGLAVVGGGVALGFGDPFFAAAQAEIERSACLDSRPVPASCPPGWAATAACWAVPASASSARWNIERLWPEALTTQAGSRLRRGR